MRRLLAALRTPSPATLATPGGRAFTEAAHAPAAEAEEPPGACGWFDSSHALQHGLCVTEHASADAVSAELPLADWLQLHLCGWSAASGQTPHAGIPSSH